MAQGRQYTEEFRQEAMRLVRETGKSAKQVAKEIGMSQTTLSKWLREEEPKEGSARSQTEIERENERLRRELRETKMERDFLRDAAAYFAKQKQ